MEALVHRGLPTPLAPPSPNIAGFRRWSCTGAPGRTGTRAGGTCLLHRSLYLTSGGTQPPVGRASLARGSHPKGTKRSRCPRRPPCPGLAVAEVAPARHRSDLRRGREVALFTFQRPECPPVLPGGRVASRSCRDAELTRPLRCFPSQVDRKTKRNNI